MRLIDIIMHKCRLLRSNADIYELIIVKINRYTLKNLVFIYASIKKPPFIAIIQSTLFNLIRFVKSRLNTHIV